jgi:hypothetical protein
VISQLVLRSQLFFQTMVGVVVTKVVFLVAPMLSYIPKGFYSVEHENEECYVIHGIFHNKRRFIKPSSLLLELL